MDYEVFLVARMREAYVHGDRPGQAIASGFRHSARVVVAAALIMIAVFLAFVSASVPSIKQIGLANAVAIGIDATVVRLVIVPAAMELLGRWNWWLPRPLARVLPKASFEELPVPSSA
jgi:RND superfamily putative drug exporter